MHIAKKQANDKVLATLPRWREVWRFGADAIAARGGAARMLFGDDLRSIPPPGARALIEHWLILDTFGTWTD